MGAFVAMAVLRREMSARRAGSRGDAPGWCRCVRWRAGLPPALEGLDDEHAPAAAGTGREMIERLWQFDRLWRGHVVKVFGCRPSQVWRQGMGPAYGNRPCTNPRGCGGGLWGFEVLLC